jgi:uncharacterized protein YjbJ (UPF0337 family)
MPGGSSDKAKGRLKEAGGVVSGDRGLRREGKVERASGETKHGIDRLKEGIENLVGGRRRRADRRPPDRY